MSAIESRHPSREPSDIVYDALPAEGSRLATSLRMAISASPDRVVVEGRARLADAHLEPSVAISWRSSDDGRRGDDRKDRPEDREERRSSRERQRAPSPYQAPRERAPASRAPTA